MNKRCFEEYQGEEKHGESQQEKIQQIRDNITAFLDDEKAFKRLSPVDEASIIKNLQSYWNSIFELLPRLNKRAKHEILAYFNRCIIRKAREGLKIQPETAVARLRYELNQWCAKSSRMDTVGAAERRAWIPYNARNKNLRKDRDEQE